MEIFMLILEVFIHVYLRSIWIYMIRVRVTTLRLSKVQLNVTLFVIETLEFKMHWEEDI